MRGCGTAPVIPSDRSESRDLHLGVLTEITEAGLGMLLAPAQRAIRRTVKIIWDHGWRGAKCQRASLDPEGRSLCSLRSPREIAVFLTESTEGTEDHAAILPPDHQDLGGVDRAERCAGARNPTQKAVLGGLCALCEKKREQ